MGFDYTVSGKDKGLTYIFLEQAKKQEGFDANKKINWQQVMSVFDEIQKEEQSEGQKLFRGGTDKTRAGWGKSYTIQAGDKISLSDEQMNKIYGAMGLDLSKTKPQQQTSPNPQQVPPTPSAQPSAQTTATETPPSVDTTPSVHGPSPSEPDLQASVAEQPEASQVTDKQKQDFNKAIADFKTSETVPDVEYLKADGFGSVKIGSGEYNLNKQDENGLYYVMDMNGGRTYTNSRGENIRISSFEAQFVEKDAVSVTYSSGKNSNSIVYNKNGKPLQGTLIEKQQDGSSVVYTYKYESGKPVLQSVNALQNFDKEQNTSQTITYSRLPEKFGSLMETAADEFFDRRGGGTVDLTPYESIEENMFSKQKQDSENLYSEFWDNTPISSFFDGAVGVSYSKGAFCTSSEEEFESIKPLAKTVCNMLTAGKEKYIELLQGEKDFRSFVKAGKASSLSKEDWSFLVSYNHLLDGMNFGLDENGGFIRKSAK